MIRHHSTAFSYKPQHSFPEFFSRPAGHGLVCTDKTMLSSFLTPRQETTRTVFCNYMASEVEALEDKDFQTFRKEAVKLLSSIQSRTEERSFQPQQPTLSKSSSATSTFVPHTFNSHSNQHQLQETQMAESQVIQPAQQNQVATTWQPRGQLTSFIVVDDLATQRAADFLRSC